MSVSIPNPPTAEPPSHIAHGTPWALRDFIAEALAGVHVSAELGVTYARLGDDTWLEYSVRKVVAYTRQAAATLADLRAGKAEGALK